MRIAIRLDEEPFDETTCVPATHGRTLAACIEDSSRERLVRRRASPPGQQTRLATTSEGGVLPGIDRVDSASLLDAMASLACGPSTAPDSLTGATNPWRGVR